MIFTIIALIFIVAPMGALFAIGMCKASKQADEEMEKFFRNR